MNWTSFFDDMEENLRNILIEILQDKNSTPNIKDENIKEYVKEMLNWIYIAREMIDQ